MKVIIAGSRTLSPSSQTLDALVERSGFDISVLVNGRHWEGVDSAAWRWGQERGLDLIGCPANWKTRRKSAGPWRNGLMASLADALILIWDGTSSGSLSMLENALSRKLPVALFLPHKAPVPLLVSSFHDVGPALDGWYEAHYKPGVG